MNEALGLRVAHRVKCTQAEGPHRRYALWLQGCSLRCPGCCNPELFDAAGGTSSTVEAELGLIEAAVGLGIEGVTILGGEPLEQLAGVAALCRGAQARGLGVIVFSGYGLEAAEHVPGFPEARRHIDTLVDGPFDATQPEMTRRFIGSRNQGLRHQSSRYADERLWIGDNHVEVRIQDGRVTAHGYPGAVRRALRTLSGR